MARPASTYRGARRNAFHEGKQPASAKKWQQPIKRKRLADPDNVDVMTRLLGIYKPPKYTRAKLRAIRAKKGVGRPPKPMRAAA